jgi:toxin ParE1/3/4
MTRVIRRRLGRQDLVEIFRHYAREAGLDIADAFLAEAEAAFTQIAAMPQIGTRYEHEHEALADLRFLPLSRFRKYLVFYRPIPQGIEIVRVLHGARDFHGILAEEFVDDEAGDDA